MREIIEQVARAQDAAQDIDTQPRGKLRVSAPVSMGSSMIAPLIALYHQRFAHVAVELALDNAMVNLDGLVTKASARPTAVVE